MRFFEKIPSKFFGTSSLDLKLGSYLHTINDLGYKTRRQLEHPQLRPSQNGPGENGYKVLTFLYKSEMNPV